MHNEELNKAKAIFLNYSGSYFHMARESVLDNYLNYSISKQQELEWIKEYQQQLAEDIMRERVVNHSMVFLVMTICNYRNIEGIKMLIEVIQHMMDSTDSFTQLRMAEELIEVYHCVYQDNVLLDSELQKLRELAIQLLTLVVACPITVAEYYRNELPKELICEDAVNARARKNLKRILRD